MRMEIYKYLDGRTRLRTARLSKKERDTIHTSLIARDEQELQICVVDLLMKRNVYDDIGYDDIGYEKICADLAPLIAIHDRVYLFVGEEDSESKNQVTGLLQVNFVFKLLKLLPERFSQEKFSLRIDNQITDMAGCILPFLEIKGQLIHLAKLVLWQSESDSKCRITNNAYDFIMTRVSKLVLQETVISRIEKRSEEAGICKSNLLSIEASTGSKLDFN